MVVVVVVVVTVVVVVVAVVVVVVVVVVDGSVHPSGGTFGSEKKTDVGVNSTNSSTDRIILH